MPSVDFLEDTMERITVCNDMLVLMQTASVSVEAAVTLSESNDALAVLLPDGPRAVAWAIQMQTVAVLEKMHGLLRQAAFLIARDIIAATARYRCGDGAVKHLTGNSYEPPIRCIEEADAIYQLSSDREGTLFSTFIEELERRVEAEQVEMFRHDDDNMLFVVDLRRWQRKDLTDQEREALENYNDEWEPVT